MKTSQCPNDEPKRAASTLPPEIVVRVRADGFVQYVGTAAQLKAEQLIPAGLVWPEKAEPRTWEVKGLRYILRRERPQGHRGPMRSWMGLDHWYVMIQVVGRDWRWQRQYLLQQKAQELAELQHRLSAKGQAETNELVRRAVAAQEDRAFQRLMSKVLPAVSKRCRGKRV